MITLSFLKLIPVGILGYFFSSLGRQKVSSPPSPTIGRNDFPFGIRLRIEVSPVSSSASVFSPFLVDKNRRFSPPSVFFISLSAPICIDDFFGTTSAKRCRSKGESASPLSLGPPEILLSPSYGEGQGARRPFPTY